MAIVEDLYKKLSEGGYYTKTLGEFETQLNDPEYRKKVHSVVTRDGIENTDFETFDLKYTPLKKKEESVSPSMVSETSGSLATPEMGTQEPLESSSLENKPEIFNPNPDAPEVDVMEEIPVSRTVEITTTEKTGGIFKKKKKKEEQQKSFLTKEEKAKGEALLKENLELFEKWEAQKQEQEYNESLMKGGSVNTDMGEGYRYTNPDGSTGFVIYGKEVNVTAPKQQKRKFKDKFEEFYYTYMYPVGKSKNMREYFRLLKENRNNPDYKNFIKYASEEESIFKDARNNINYEIFRSYEGTAKDLLNRTLSRYGYDVQEAVAGEDWVKIISPGGQKIQLKTNVLGGASQAKDLLEFIYDTWRDEKEIRYFGKKDYEDSIKGMDNYMDDIVDFALTDVNKFKNLIDSEKFQSALERRAKEASVNIENLKSDIDFFNTSYENYNSTLSVRNNLVTKYNDELNKYKKSGKKDLAKEEELKKYYQEIQDLEKTYDFEGELKNLQSQQSYIEDTKSIIEKEAKDLDDMSKALTLSLPLQQAEKEKQGSFLGFIGAKFIGGVFDVYETVGYLATDVMTPIMGEISGIESMIPKIEYEELKKQGLSDSDVYDKLQKDFKRKLTKDFNGIKEYLFDTTEEYMQSSDRSTFEVVLGSVLESVGAVVGLPNYPGVAFAAQSYGRMEEMMLDPLFDELSEGEKKLISVPYAIAMGQLEKFGFNVLSGANKSLANKLIINTIGRAMTKLPKNASIDLIKHEINKDLSSMLVTGGLDYFLSGGAEGFVEGTQSIMETSIKNVVNAIYEKELFQNVPDLTTYDGIIESFSQAGKDAYLGMLGGYMFGAVANSVNIIKQKKFTSESPELFDEYEKFLKDDTTLKTVENLIKIEVNKGSITEEEGLEVLESIKECQQLVNVIPDNLSADDAKNSFNLLLEKKNLEREIAGKDEALVAGQKERIEQINNELKTISRNAIEESTKQQQEGTAEGGVVQREGVDQGQPQVGQGEGAVGETTQPEADLGDSTVAGGRIQETEVVTEQPIAEEVVTEQPIAEEVVTEQPVAEETITEQPTVEEVNIVPGETAVVSDVQITYPTNEEAEVRREERTRPEYVEATSENLQEENVEQLSQELEGEFGLLTAENPMAQPLTEEENAQLNQKAEEWLKSRGYNPRRVTGKYDQAENSFFVPNLTFNDAVEFANEFNQEAVAHSEGLVYQDGTINPRVKQDDDFSFQSYSPESNFVSVVKTPSGLKTFSVGYNTKIRTNFTDPSQSSMGTVISGTDVEIETRAAQISKPRMTKIVANAAKAVSRILPNNKFIVHDTQDSFTAATGETDAGGYFNPASGEIHINLEQANARTVAHEVFHAVLLNAVKTDANAAVTTRKMIEAVSKKIDSNPQLKQYLDDFASNYEDNIQNEEKVSELVGVLAEQYESSTESVKDVIKRWLDRIAKAFGLNPFNRNEVYDVLNTVARKTAKGKKIKESDISKVIPSATDKYGNLRKPSESSIKNLKNRKQKIVDEAKSNVVEGKTVSTRLPKKNDVHSRRDYIVSMKSLEADAVNDKKIQEQYIKIAKEISSYSISKIKNVENFDDAKKVVNDFKDSVKSNLKWLHDSFGNDVRDISKLWYDGANIICNNIASEYNYSLEQVSGVMAVLSPQMDWFRNLSLGERVIDIYTKQQDSIFDSKMIEYVNNATSGTGKNKVPLFKDAKEISSRVKGKKLSELNNKDKAYFIRVFDEVYNSREYNNISPNGEINGLVRKSDGSPGACGWGAFPTIEKSISILQDGSIENISSNLGNMHKVRNFFNNISNPNDLDAVTIDTHAVAAGLLLPLSGSSKQVLYNFGGAGNVNTGMTGTYPVYADAYRELANELGLLPREVQSITWEAVRGLFKAAFKSNKNNELNINKVWDDYSSGLVSLEEAHSEIENIAGGISKPVWYEYMADGNEKSMDKNSAAVDQSNLDNESEQPAPRRQKSLPKEVADKLTEDGKGNYIFHHYSGKRRETIQPRSGDNIITSREEAAALSSVGGVAQFYTQEGQKEAGVGPVLHTIVVPKDKVYYLQNDVENFYAEAKRQFLEVRPGQAFNANYQAAWIGKVAADNGYDMLVSNWRGDELRAQTVKELTPIEENIPFKEREANVYKVGDEVIVYGSKATITAMDGTVATFKGEGVAGSIDTDRNANLITKARRQKSLKNIKALDIMDKNKKYIKDRTKKTTAKDIAESYIQKFEDRQSDIKRSLRGVDNVYSKRALNVLVNKAGASGWANEVFKEAQKKIYGRKLNRNLLLSVKDMDVLNAMIYAMRIIAINKNRSERGMKAYKGMDGYSTSQAEADLQEIKNAIGDEKYADFENRTKEYFKVYENLLKEAYESGRITEKIYNMLKDIEYSPIKTLKYLIGEDQFSSTDIDEMSKTLGIRGDEIRKLSDENENAFAADTRWLMMMSINAGIRKNFENKLLNAVFDTIENANDSETYDLLEDFYEPNPIIGKTKTGSLIHKYDKVKIPIGYKELIFYKNGVKRKMVMKKKYADQLLDLNKVPDTLKQIGKLSGGSLLRFFATSGNPFFILGNVPADFSNILFLSDVYGKFKPVGAVHLAFDFVKNFLRATFGINYKKIKREYLENGGAMDYMSSDGIRQLLSKEYTVEVLGIPVLSIPRKALVTYARVASFLGEKSEEAFRLSVYEKTKTDLIKKYKKENNKLEPKGQDLEDIRYESVREAREVIDFNQGGEWAKNIDAVMPYFNAGMQGLRRTREYAAKNPYGFASSMVQGTIMAAGIVAYSMSVLIKSVCADAEDEDDCNKKMMDALNSIPEYERANYHIIFTGEKDEKGEWEYWRIKKLPGFSVITTYAEQLFTKFYFGSRGADYDTNGDIMWNTIKSSIPFYPENVLGKNPLVAAGIAYGLNYDTFKGEEIFKKPRGWEDREISPEMEGINDDNVNSLFKYIAPALGMSPIRTQAMFEKIITSESTNPTLSILYAVANGIFDEDTDLGESFSIAKDEFLKNAGRKLIRSTNKNILKYDEQDAERQQEISINDEEYNAVGKMYKDIGDIYDSGKTLTGRDLQDMIIERFNPVTKKEFVGYFNRFNNHIKNRGTDTRLLNIVFEDRPKLQAFYLYKRYGSTLDNEELNELNTIMQQTKSRISNETLIYYNNEYKNK